MVTNSPLIRPYVLERNGIRGVFGGMGGLDSHEDKMAPSIKNACIILSVSELPPRETKHILESKLSVIQEFGGFVFRLHV